MTRYGRDMRTHLRRLMQRSLGRLDRAQRRYLEIRHGDPLAQDFAAFGRRSRFAYPRLQLVGAASVSIGERVSIRSYCSIEALAPPGTVVLTIGNDVHVGHWVRFVALNGIVVEDDVVFGHGITVSDTIHTWKDAGPDTGIGHTPLKVGRPLRIGRGSWIGNNCVITGGITLGERTIVTPNTFVNRDVPDGTMIGGNPARQLRREGPDGWEWLVDPSTFDLDASVPTGEQR